jgi:hypothetical protein
LIDRTSWFAGAEAPAPEILSRVERRTFPQ